MPDQRSRGNHRVIAAFLDSATAFGQRAIAEQLIDILPDKDLQDITLDILLDNLPPSLSTLPSSLLSSPSSLPTSPSSPLSSPSSLLSFFRSYLLSPRIERERLTPFKAPLRAALSHLYTSSLPSESPTSTGFVDGQSSESPTSTGFVDGGFSAVTLPFALLAWTRDSLTLIDDQNPQQLRMSPLAVLLSRTADRLSRDIFFVAACRALGIPARINEIDGKVQYYAPPTSPSTAPSSTWVNVTFDSPFPSVSTSSPTPFSSAAPSSSSSLSPSTSLSSSTSPSPSPSSSPSPSASPSSFAAVPAPSGAVRSRLLLAYHPTRFVPDAQYYTHFTLSRLDTDGSLQLLTFPEEATVSNTFSAGIELDPGTYILTTGTRLADGSVLASLQSVTLTAGTTTRLPFTLREQPGAVAVIGSLNAENLYHPWLVHDGFPVVSPTTAPSSPPVSLLSTAGRGYYVLGLLAPNHEPTNHALRDISRAADAFNDWNRKIILLFDSPASASRFNFQEFSSLPSSVTWGTDIDGSIRDELITSLLLPTSSLPIFVIADSFNRIVFLSQGYTIGLGEQMSKVIQQLR